jgi:aconitase A
MVDSFGAHKGLGSFALFHLDATGFPIERLPYCLRIVLENLLRHEDGITVTRDDILALATWDGTPPSRPIAFRPARLLLDDVTALPALVDLAAMRDAVATRGGHPGRVEPFLPIDLIASPGSLDEERARFLSWARSAFPSLRVIPRETSLAAPVVLRAGALAYPDTVVGTDPLVNGLGVLGWSVGGLEAEAAMLGQPLALPIPRVVGLHLHGERAAGVSSTDLAVAITDLLRQKGVVGQLVEAIGPGVEELTTADRTMIAGIAPYLGALCIYFPLDGVTLQTLRRAGRSHEDVLFIERYARAQRLLRLDGVPVYSDSVELDLSAVRAGLLRPATAARAPADLRDEDLLTSHGALFRWDPLSTTVRRPTFFEDPTPDVGLTGARALCAFGDRVTTDLISPAGTIGGDSPAGRYLQAAGVTPARLDTYGAHRGNHEVMRRGTFANIRLRNRLVLGVEGGFTTHLPSGDVMTIFDAALRYGLEGVAVVLLAGKQYGAGASEDWAAKGPRLLGVRAVIAESFDRVHRANLVGMGILPLELDPNQSLEALGITGRESFDVLGARTDRPRVRATVKARRSDGRTTQFRVTVRTDTPTEVSYHRHGGVLPYVMRRLLAGERAPQLAADSARP